MRKWDLKDMRKQGNLIKVAERASCFYRYVIESVAVVGYDIKLPYKMLHAFLKETKVSSRSLEAL